MARRIRGVTAVLAAVSVAGLTGCGGDRPSGASAGSDVDPQADPVAYFEALAAASAEAGSYRFDVTVDTAGSTSEGTGVVVMDGEKLTTRAVMQMPGLSGEAAAEVTTIIAEGTMYMQFPPDENLPEGQWVTMDQDDGPWGQLIGGASTGVVDTSQFAELGGDLELSVTDGEEIDGVPTEDVSLTISSEQLAAMAPEGMPASVFDGIGQADYVFTVDEDLLIHEVTVSLGELYDMTTTLYDYGVDETIEVPAAEDTVPFEDYMQDAFGDLDDSLGDLTLPTPDS